MVSGIDNCPSHIFTNCYSAAFKTYAPAVYDAYAENMDALLASDASLKRNFPNTVFGATTVNFGPRTVCKRHIDSLNLSWGWCGISAAGEFDPTLGGHLVVDDIGYAIEFPSGSTILLPSALFIHSNLPVQEHEKRYSITQYSAGGLFRWVYNGFQTDKSFEKIHGANREKMEKRDSDYATRWEEAMEKFTVWGAN